MKIIFEYSRFHATNLVWLMGKKRKDDRVYTVKRSEIEHILSNKQFKRYEDGQRNFIADEKYVKAILGINSK